MRKFRMILLVIFVYGLLLRKPTDLMDFPLPHSSLLIVVCIFLPLLRPTGLVRAKQSELRTLKRQHCCGIDLGAVLDITSKFMYVCHEHPDLTTKMLL